MTTSRPNRQIHLVSRPLGEASAANFRAVDSTIAEPADGELLIRQDFLSLDPSTRATKAAAAA